MAKNKFPSCAPAAHTLIIRDATGEKIGGMSTQGNEEYAKKLARSILTTPPVKVENGGTWQWHPASIEIYRHDPNTTWQQLQPLCSVTLDDETEE